jgi:hypothetical protein
MDDRQVWGGSKINNSDVKQWESFASPD